jgi:hypothetical protein
MATKTTGRDTMAEIAFLTRALKAPTLRESVPRLAERARAESWTHEEFLAACLQREVAARESHGGEGRIRAARFPSRNDQGMPGLLARIRQVHRGDAIGDLAHASQVLPFERRRRRNHPMTFTWTGPGRLWSAPGRVLLVRIS